MSRYDNGWHNIYSGADGGSPSTTSESTRRDRAAHEGIVTAVANQSFLDSCSSHLMLTNKKTNQEHPIDVN
ncbi:hypothetical protein Y032_0068g249 [Ancylostoma ceylanicum]|uniref:Uncharacterized protein n=1 Tax=Ancylostoma ceylanicum TaxID=53326 RepID=A0A016TYZ4_9BILA|nr:hypothetical protein Y032_0068g249 [Ancylostoma ceylanicum]